MDIVDTFFNVGVLVRYFPLLLEGLWRTIALGVLSIVLGLVGGLVLAMLRLYGGRFVRFLVIAYVDVFRALPVLVWLVIVYYALPFVGIRLSAFASATTALTMISSAYTAEIYRAGIQAIPRGQFEAAQSIGLSQWYLMRDVVLPQAFRIVIPPLTNNSINVMKDTALASVVALPDLLKQATQAQALAANPTPLIGAALLYLLLLLPLVRLVAVFEARYAAKGAR
ncbi:amino acid ABC transporter permease [Aurantimonas endophytica]|uniref:Polar amino acid transport system permease protein n=1 Tax=Aurantimonas endophytica TaxID=1522175 RepID=A0A7W6MRK2_9HYPH|nr:amino acid ABC transporter permease [Aurantimonas endophytica]MBB4005147.1 polar amino acid transport system permease protein [Aurantimonas endophytica]MCO6406190.1 ABC transporter permease subunit [Aurantimonas endophytica]